jgi:hypothetical protein
MLCKKLSRGCPAFVNPLFALNGEWEREESLIHQYASRHIGDTIQPGTLLYHGTRNSELDFDSFEPSRATFFGVEPMIALWYTLEESERLSLCGKSYVYEFVVTEPIALDRYIYSLKEHPGVETCVHPQVALHGYHNYHALMGPFDLSIEVTLTHTHLRKLSLRKRYGVDVERLSRLVSYPIGELNLIETVDELYLETLSETAEKVRSRLRKVSLTL